MVAVVVLLETQVATLVTSTVPLQVVAIAVNWTGLPAVVLGMDGVTAMDWMQGTVTVTVVELVIETLSLAVAVRVVCPTHVTPLEHAAVTSPPGLIVATLGWVLIQLTDGFPVLPSL